LANVVGPLARKRCVAQCDCGAVSLQGASSLRRGRSRRCRKCANAAGLARGVAGRRQASPTELSAALLAKPVHGNTGKQRKTEHDGQIPLLCNVTGNGRVCQLHAEPMTFHIEQRKRRGSVQPRGRWECPLCSVLRRKRGGVAEIEEAARQFIAGGSRRVGYQAVKLLPADLRAEYEAEASRRECERRSRYGRDRNLLSKYGIDQARWQQMWDDQRGLCASCEDPFEAGAGGCAVDHCHETGRVRGLLCRSCNIGLGHFRDDPERLKRAVEYLRIHRAQGAAA
jgi:hypothetical protein